MQAARDESLRPSRALSTHSSGQIGSIAWPLRPNDASSHKFFGSSRKKRPLGLGAEPTRFGSPQHTEG
jgi:hypothetical protein